MIEVILSPIIFSTYILFIGQWLTGSHQPLFIAFLLALGLLTSLIYLKFRSPYLDLHRLKRQEIISHLPAIGIILLYTAIIALLISPLVIVQKVGSQQFFRFPGSSDYFKHVYMVTTIKETGVIPSIPFYPSQKMVYYFGYYLIPASISGIFSLPETTSIFLWIVSTTFISLLLLYVLIVKLIKTNYVRVAALIACIFGSGFDIIPIILKGQHDVPKHIETWFGLQDPGLIVENIYTALYWLPQHLFPAIIGLLLIYLLIKEKINNIFFLLSLIFIGLSSTFVSIVLGIQLILTTIFYPKLKKQIISVCLLAPILVLPYIHMVLSKGGSFVYRYIINPYPFFESGSKIGDYIGNISLNIILEFGALSIVLLFILIFSHQKLLKKIFLILGIYSPLVLTLFFRSVQPNDFSLKVNLVPLLLIPLIFFIFVDKISKKRKITITLIAILFCIPGVLGAAYEYSIQWKERYVFDYKISNLETAIKKLPENKKLAVVDREEWVYLIPVIGGRTVLAPSLFDFFPAVSSKGLLSQKLEYEKDGMRIFNYGVIAENGTKLIEKKNHDLGQIPEFFSLYQFDWLLLPQKKWVKQDRNFWFSLLSDLGVKSEKLTDDFSLFDRESLIKKVKTANMHFDISKTEVINSKNDFRLKKGYWFIWVCSGNNTSIIKLELEDYYTFLNSSVPPNNCLGQQFYLPVTQDLNISSTTNVKSFYATPLEYNQ